MKKLLSRQTSPTLPGYIARSAASLSKPLTVFVAVLLFSAQFASAQRADTVKSGTPQMSYGFYTHKHHVNRIIG